MRFSRVLRNFLFGYFLLHLAMASVFLLVLTRFVRTQMVDETRDRMKAMASVLRVHIESDEKGVKTKEILPLIQKMAHETGARFTLIAESGVVVADSETGLAPIGDHGNRPEVIQARSYGIGVDERTSATLEIPMLYLAMRYTNASGQAQQNGFVRVAVPAGGIHQAVIAVQRFVWLFAICLGGATGLIMSWFAIREMKPLNHYASTAREIAGGNYQIKESVSRRNDEWTDLNDAFTHMKTELANREIRLNENHQRLQAVLGSMVEGVLAIDNQEKIVVTNKAACRILDVSRPNLLDRHLFEMVRIPGFQESVKDAINQRKPVHTEFQTISEPRRTLNMRVVPLSDSHDSGFAIVLYNVTELRRLESMRRDFAANVSHELKTPLAAIKAYAETLKLGAVNDQENNLRFVRHIESNAELLHGQIRDLLHLAKVESGNVPFEKTRVDLNHLIQKCSEQFEAESVQRNVEIVCVQSPSDVSAYADQEAVETILNNLVSNAVRYSRTDGTVEIRASLKFDDPQRVVINVTDNGVGISKEHLDRVFERFYRVDKARSRDVGGTGLGLAIVKHTAHAMSGSVELDSKIGKGTHVKLELPRFFEKQESQ